MLGKLLTDLADVAGDVARVVVAPVEVAATIAKAATKPLADAAAEVVQTVRDVVE